jgi:dCTP deaminase
MILSDVDIRREVKKGHLLISPYDSSSVQPASYDVKLGHEFRIFKNIHKPFLDVKNHLEDFMELIKIKKRGHLIIHPGEFVLGTTVEKVKIPKDLIARLDGKSSLGRLGIIVHATAGYIDPGFNGYITLEMTNVANIPITLYPGMRIGQVSFMRLETPAGRPYGRIRKSKYQGQKGPTVSRVWRDFKGKK